MGEEESLRMEDGGGAGEAAAEIEYVSYSGEHQLPLIMGLVDQELSEPYSIFTYRYFVYLWPQLSFLIGYSGHKEHIGVSQGQMYWNCRMQDGRASPSIQGLHCYAGCRQTLQRTRHCY
ncbi:acyl-CoA N-acyltransferases (NAT) superfamily protein isoform X2 [Wolffia australiana]